MTYEEFEDMLDKIIQTIKYTLKNKAEDYATNKDRLHNFNLAAQINNQRPEQALWGMATKHLISIIDIIERDKQIDLKRVDEKCIDMINYLILLIAVLTERHKYETRSETNVTEYPVSNV